MNELKFEVKQNLGTIDINFDALKKQLSEKMQEYKGYVFTEDTKSIAKAERAGLNKLRTAVEDRRKEIKVSFMEPYTAFEGQVKELVSLINEPIAVIDEQLAEFERKRVEVKRTEINKIYDDLLDEIKEVLPLEKIYDPKWENASVTLKSVRTAIGQAGSKVQSEIETLNMMQSDAKSEALNIYKNTLDLAKAIQHINQYERQKSMIQEREKERKAEEERKALEAERERIRKEERERITAEERVAAQARKEAVEQIKSVDLEAAAPITAPESQRVIYTVVATKEEQEEIEMALTSLGVYFERKDV